MPKPTLKRKSSNEVVEEIWQRNQDFLAHRNRAPTPELPPNFDDDLEDALEWGSNEEMKYAFSSFNTLDANTSTVLVPSSIKGECNNTSPCRTDCRNARQNQLQKGRKGR